MKKWNFRSYLLRLWKLITQPDMLVLPGQLAFFFLLALVPTVTVLAYGASLFHLSFDFLTNFMTKAFGPDISNLIMPIVRDVQISPQFILTIIIGFYAASTGAASIIISSNQMYGLSNKSFLHRRIKALFMMIVLIFLLLFLLFIPVFGDKIVALLSFVNLNEKVTQTIAFAIKLIRGPVSWFVSFFLIKIIYTMAPDREIPSSTNTYGALFATFGFVFVTMIYSFYINHFYHSSSLYGGLAQVVVLMVWLYMLAYIFVIGIAINAQQLEKIGEIKKE